ncbi:tripartite ATP-independent transporter solute receptor, DctP family [Nonlabens sp. Hel1_33_55]|uniref:TRAP transporter substrate-binding protein n=1 Tax=Nonlabens sp. Hel1_33_55 TaxID=1336802 RepID=UPI000875E5C6|nr:TRAP transporter substrate-binding protein [Nonlabens sp. Hel1_33_55]SCY10616.1 tripartite ATP-independent transporter solute receptor, DctP family [Nonlabens sp. Hel1_33_55]
MKIQYLLLLIPILLLSSCGGGEEEVTVLRLAHSLDTEHPVHKGMVVLGESLERKSGGKMKVQLYPNGQLGGERESIELLQIGSLDITKVSAGILENFIPEYKVFSIPYLFRDKQHSHDIYDGKVGRQILDQGEKFNLHGLTFYDAGSRSFYTKTDPINSPKDLQDMKIRVMKSNMAIEMIHDLGGAPTPISFGELYTALQQGVVDGAENNIPSFYTSKHFEVCKFLSIDEHTSLPDVLVIGTQTLARLSDQEKQWLQEAVLESKNAQRELWDISEKESLEKVIESGVKVNYPEKQSFRQATKEMLEIFNENPNMKKLVQSIQEN